MDMKSHATTTKGHNDQLVLTLLVNHKGTDIYRVTVDADSYPHQAKVTVSKWTNGAGFQQVTQERLDQYTSISGLGATKELLNSVAWDALNPVLALF